VKFKIRFADQIVGFFVVLSLVSVVVVIVLLGRSQRWFAKDLSFHTILPTAGGVSKNMDVQYRGFTIGKIKNFYLTDEDDVEVVFTIQDEYKDRVRKGSLVEMMISPVNLGNQFLFHAGKGEMLAENTLIPAVGSDEAKQLVTQGLAEEPRHDDSISLLMSRASSILDDVGRIVTQVNEALGPGSDATNIGKIMGSVQKTMAGAEVLPQTVDRTTADITKQIELLQAELKPILVNISALTTELNNPNGLLYTVLDTNSDVYTNLVKSLRSVSAILDNLDKTAAFIPGQVPQLAGLISDLRVTMKSAQDVLVALTNNPLFRGGIPQKLQTQGGGTSPRDIQF